MRSIIMTIFLLIPLLGSSIKPILSMERESFSNASSSSGDEFDCDAERCGYCRLDLADGQCMMTLPCGEINKDAKNHTFHVNCIIQWLNPYKSCPSCRTSCLSPKELSAFIYFFNQKNLGVIFNQSLNSVVFACLSSHEYLNGLPHELVQSGDADVLPVLVNLGADIYQCDENGDTPSSLAFKLRDLDALWIFLDLQLKKKLCCWQYKKNDDIVMSKKEEEKLIQAYEVLQGHRLKAMAAYLKEEGVPVDVNNSVSPAGWKKLANLTSKVVYKFLATVEQKDLHNAVLLLKKAHMLLSLFGYQNYLQALLSEAVCNGNKAMISGITALGANVNAPDHKGQLPLGIALRNGKVLTALEIVNVNHEKFKHEHYFLRELLACALCVSVILNISLNFNENPIMLMSINGIIFLAYGIFPFFLYRH